MRVLGRRGIVVAALLGLFAMIAAPGRAQPPSPNHAATVATPSQAKPPESAATPGQARPPESAAAPSQPKPPESAAAPSQPKPPEGAPAPGPVKPSERAATPNQANPAESATAPPAPPTAPAQPPESPFADLFAKLAKRVVGVVVNISTEAAPPTTKTAQDAPQNTPGATLDEVFRDFLGDKAAPGEPGPRIASLGSGFIIDPSGLIVTNNHVIANAEQITVTLSDNTELQAHVVGRDLVTDLALLKVDAKTPLPAAAWGDSNKAGVGDWVLAIGNPFGLGGTVTAGIISATARDIHSSPYDDYLQTDASINRGNSGGPMFNLAGEVIGINTVIYSPSGGSIGIGFAIPSALARPIIEQLETTGKVERGWIGARIQPVTDDIAESVGLDKSRGAMIAAIDPDSPAAQAKLQPGDVLLSYDGTAIERSRQLPRLVAATPPDKQVNVSVWRDGKEHEFALKVAALNPNRPPPAPPAPEKPKPPVTVDALGLKLARLSPELRKQFSLPETAKGAVITAVPPNGAAAAQGLRPGDLVIAIGHASIRTAEEVPQIAAAAKKAGQKKVLVRIERNGGTRFVALPVDATS
ncbi:MAG TPA: Do family serine endopeptidase [Stellaceae bacterium]|nr:Do family serine endopeptidase [Stellaceae bacterium]